MINKITLTLVACIIIHPIVNGQISAKLVSLGGAVTYVNYKIHFTPTKPDVAEKGANINLSVGKLFRENSEWGVNLSCTPLTYTNFFNGSQYVNYSYNQYGLGIYFRKYKKVATDFYFYAEAGGGYLFSKTKYTDTSDAELETTKQNGGQLYVTLGLNYRLFGKFYLDLVVPKIVNVQYLVTNDVSQTQTSKENDFYFNTSLNSSGGLGLVGVGFKFIF